MQHLFACYPNEWKEYVDECDHMLHSVCTFDVNALSTNVCFFGVCEYTVKIFHIPSSSPRAKKFENNLQTHIHKTKQKNA